MSGEDSLAESLRLLRSELELRFTGQFVENAVCTIDAARSQIETLQADLAQCAKGHAEIAAWYEDAAQGWTAAQVQVADLQTRLDVVGQERDGARKALDCLLNDPEIPAGVLVRVRIQMQHYKEPQHEG